MSALEIKSVSKSFGSKPILEDVHLKVSNGKSHVLLGSSGSGKSTLLKIILGLTAADSGTLAITGEDLDLTQRGARQHRFGYVPQDGGLFPHLTAQENVSLVAETLGWSRKKIRARIEELSDIVSLNAELLEQYPHELSGGQKQRVAVMRAVFLDPPIILLDEPFGALDPIVRADVQSRLREIFRRLQKTVLFITHDLSEAAYLGDEVTLLKDGRVLQTGTLDDLIERPTDPYVTQFINAQRSWETT